MSDERQTFTDQEALNFHRYPTPGKIAIAPTKPMATQRDLSLAYSPGVAIPVLAIAADPLLAYEYTSKGNLVAVITNGTAILGLGDLGALASKPVMEGKSVLFKRFADVDSVDVEISSRDADEIITVVKNIGVTYGGINLEDIKSPECFRIESELQDLLDIPVFHDDQHGTAIISCAGLINACEITGRKLGDVKLVLCGAGAAGIATLDLVKAMGARPENCIAVDNTGVIYRGRGHGMNQWKSAHAIDTDARTLADAMVGADVFLGVSVKGAVTQDMIASMAEQPIVFAMANPDPEITPEEVLTIRPDAIVATGRSDYPNQVNNVLGFPYIFRGALDVRARRVNLEMKIACARALAALAREDVPDEVAAAYHGQHLKFGRQYIIPTPFDPRLIHYVPPFVAQAAMDSGVARTPITDMDAYRESLARRLDPTAGFLQKISGAVQSGPQRRIVFAEGEDVSVIRAAFAFQNQRLGRAVLVGREDLVRENMVLAGLDPDTANLEVINARLSTHNDLFVEFLYKRLQRYGYLKRDVQRLINQDRNSFAAAMLAHGYADGMVTGVTRNYDQAFEEVLRVIDPEPGGRAVGMSIVLSKGRTLFIADTNVTEMPDSEDLVAIALQAARAVRRLGYEPRLAFMSYSTFGNPTGERAEKVRRAVEMLDARSDVDFEYEGEMPPELALDPHARDAYPFMRLTQPANVLIMPAIHSASISTKLLQTLGEATVVGPILLGLSKSVQICPLGASVSKIMMMAQMAAYEGSLAPPGGVMTAARSAAIGIDFGTTNTVISTLDADGRAHLASFPTAGEPIVAFRSALSFHAPPEDASARVVEAGPWAIEAYNEEPLETRFIQSFKSHAASPLFKDTRVLGKRFTFEDLLSAFLLRMRAYGGPDLTDAPKIAVVGRPVKFAGSSPDASLALRRYQVAFERLGFAEVRYAYEPVAAAFFFARQLARDATVLVGDFGGGTSDFSIVRFEFEGADIHPIPLGNAGVGVAGDAFDYRIIDHLVSTRLGKGSTYTSFGKVLPIPNRYYSAFAKWEQLAMLRASRDMTEIRSLVRSASEPDKLAALVEILDDNHGYHLYQSVSRLKEALSGEETARFEFEAGDVRIAGPVSRASFERWIAPELAAMDRAVDDVLVTAGLVPEVIDKVFLTGGSSFVPAVRRLFTDRFGADKVEVGGELISIASGLAYIGAEPDLDRWSKVAAKAC